MELQYYLDLSTKTELSKAKRSARLSNNDVLSALQAILASIAAAQGISISQLLENRRAERDRYHQIQEARRRASKHRHQEKLAARAIDLQAWNAWFDGSAHPNPGPCTIGVVLQAPDGRRWQLSQQLGHGSSSDAEYQAFIATLQLALARQASGVTIRGDSRVVLDDVLAADPKTSPALCHWRDQARTLLQQLPACELRWIPRARNVEADHLAAQARLRTKL